MGDRFRSMIESEFAEVDPPPIGDLVDNAIRDGRRLRRTRVAQRSAACFAAVGVLALGMGMATSTLRPGEAPGSGDGFAAPPGIASTAPYDPVEPSTDWSERSSVMPPHTPTMAAFPAGRQAGVGSEPPTAPPAAVLLALGTTLPAGPTIAFAGSRFDTFTGVQVFLDRGAGFGMIRVAVARYGGPTPARSCGSGSPGVEVMCTEQEGAVVETFEIESNCVQRRGVNVYRTDGIAIQVNIGSCLVDGEWGAAAKVAVDEEVLGLAEAVRIGLSPVWDERAMTETAEKAGQLYPSLPGLTSFDGVGP